MIPTLRPLLTNALMQGTAEGTEKIKIAFLRRAPRKFSKANIIIVLKKEKQSHCGYIIYEKY